MADSDGWERGTTMSRKVESDLEEEEPTIQALSMELGEIKE